MRQKKGSREALVAELTEDQGYWGFIGNEENMTAAVDGVKALENGAPSVKVGHTIYLVDSGDKTAAER